MITAPELRMLLDGLARRFENRPQADEEFRDLGAIGWGQFLDGTPKNNQVGPYGTCSGIITRSLAKRGHDRLDQSENALIKNWWEGQDHKLHAKFLGHTIRLAFLHLALRVKADEALRDIQNQIEDALLAHVRPDAMWGNFLMPGEIEDPSPRLMATALVVLSFTLFRAAADKSPEPLVKAVQGLEERILGTENLPSLHLAIASAAICSLSEYKPSRKARSKISKLAYATQLSLPELGVYFYDYEFADAESSDKASHKFKTDYFIVPIEVVLGIAGYQPHAPNYLRYRADLALKQLVANLRGFDGFYRPDNEQRISSVNQCWVAMYLAFAAAAQEDRTNALTSLFRFPDRIAYELIRQRPDKFWLDASLIFLCGITALAASLLPTDGLSLVRIIMVKVLSAVLAFLAGRFYAPVFLKRLFMERDSK